MQKDFDKWNEKKKFINKQELAKFCHSREIWWCSIGTNIGFEQDGTGKNFDRPILVIRGFNENLFFGVALMSAVWLVALKIPGIIDKGLKGIKK